MQLTLTLTESFSTIEAIEDFAARLKAAFSGFTVTAPAISNKMRPAAPVSATSMALAVAPVAAPAVAAPAVAAPAVAASHPESPVAETAPFSSVPAVPAEPKRRGRPSNASKAEAPAAVETPPSYNVAALASGPALSVEDFRAAVGKLSHKYGQSVPTVVPKVLAEFGVQYMGSVAENSRADFIASLEKALAKEAA